jgi:hypothetical protein
MSAWMGRRCTALQSAGEPMKLKAWNTLIDLSILLEEYAGRLYWYALRRRNLYLDLQEKN